MGSMAMTKAASIDRTAPPTRILRMLTHSTYLSKLI